MPGPIDPEPGHRWYTHLTPVQYRVKLISAGFWALFRACFKENRERSERVPGGLTPQTLVCYNQVFLNAFR